MYIINQEGVQAHYIRKEKTPFDMEEGVTTLAGHQVGRSQCKQFMLPPVDYTVSLPQQVRHGEDTSEQQGVPHLGLAWD